MSEIHAKAISNTIAHELFVKYMKGQAEHGGDLRDMDLLTLVNNAMEEAIDQYVYLYVIREKISAELA